MSRIALIADIHGNVAALEAVLEKIQQEGVDETWMLGDAVGFGPRPAEVMWRLRLQSTVTRFIAGNTDGYVLALGENPAPAIRPDPPYPAAPEALDNLRWTRERLKPADLQMLAGWGENLALTLDERPIRLFHGSAAGCETGVPQVTPAEEIPALIGGPGPALVVCAHLHLPFFLESEQGLKLLNPGSVGAQFDGDPRASFAIIDVQKSRLAVTFQRVEYKADAVMVDAKELGMPWLDILGPVFCRGKVTKVVRPPAPPAGAPPAAGTPNPPAAPPAAPPASPAPSGA